MVCFVACLRYCYSNVLLDPSGNGMWLFDPKVAELWKSNKFLVKILSHSHSEVADRRNRVVLIDENPPTHPILTTTPPNVDVLIYIKKKNIECVKSLDVSTLSVTIPKKDVQHAVIWGDGVGDIVIYKRSGGHNVAYVCKETDSESTMYLEKADICVLEDA